MNTRRLRLRTIEYATSLSFISVSDKLHALNALARHLGLFNDKLQLSGQVSLVELIRRSFEDTDEAGPLLEAAE